jgi:Leucine-rich repeat (LRR) protein
VLFPCNCTRGSEDGIYLECANTNLASLATGLRQAKTLIHTLTIRSCNIEKVYGDIFRPLSVRILRLEDTPIKDIADGTFEAGVGVADTLDELHLINTWLTRMPPSVTANLTRLRVLSIDGSRITYLPPNSFSRMTELTELRVANANITSLGGKSVFEGLRKLKRLSLNGNALSDLPKGTFATQGVLDYLDLAGNNFDKLENHFFPELRQLLWLNVSSNHIDRLNAQASPLASHLILREC